MPTSQSDAAAATLLLHRAQLQAWRARVPEIRREGADAARRLLTIAQSDTGQGRRVAMFLLACYNGPRFRLDLSQLRGLDLAIWDDVMRVLAMEHSGPEREIHRHFDDGGALFEALARYHGLSD